MWAVGGGLCVLAVYNLVFFVRALGPAAVLNDFDWYYGAAQLGLHHGWSHIYDRTLQAEYLNPSFPFVNPPPLAWLVAPLTALPKATAYFVFAFFLVACVGLTVPLAAGPGAQGKLLVFGTAFGLAPTMISLVYGQPVAIVLLSVVAAWWLDRRGHPILAGLALCAVVMKPSIVLLVPLAILMSGRYRTFVAWAASTSVLVAISAVSLGVDGMKAYVNLLALAAGEMQAFALGSGWMAWVATAVVAGLTLAVAWKRRGAGLELPLAVGIVGSLLISRHLNVYDLALYAPVLWLTFGGNLHWTAKVAAAAAWVVMDVAVLDASLVVAAELVLFVVLVLPDLMALIKRGAPSVGSGGQVGI